MRLETLISAFTKALLFKRPHFLLRLSRYNSHVTVRDRENTAEKNDPVLSTLDNSDFDELWLFAVEQGNILGRAIAESSFHHFADYNWDVDMGAPNFATEPPGMG